MNYMSQPTILAQNSQQQIQLQSQIDINSIERSVIPSKIYKKINEVIRNKFTSNKVIVRKEEYQKQQKPVTAAYNDNNQQSGLLKKQNNPEKKIKVRNITYFVPAYFRFELISLESVDFSNSTAQINANLYINIYYGKQLSQQNIKRLQNQLNLVLELKKYCIELIDTIEKKQNSKKAKNQQIKKSNQQKLNEYQMIKQMIQQKQQKNDFTVTMKRKRQEQYLEFKVSGLYTLGIDPECFFSPFELLEMILAFHIRTLDISKNQSICFNFQVANDKDQFGDDKNDNKDQFFCDPSKINYQNYRLANKQMYFHSSFYQFSQRVMEQQQDQKNQIRISYTKYIMKYLYQNRAKWFQQSRLVRHIVRWLLWIILTIFLSPLQPLLRLLKFIIYDIFNVKYMPSFWKLSDYKEIRKQNLAQACKQNLSTIQSGKVRSFKHGYIVIPYYKDPTTGLQSVHIPLLILEILNLLIFFQSSDMGGRISSVATVSLALFALIPTVTSQVPSIQTKFYVYKLVSMQIFAILMVLIQSYLIIGIPQFDYNYVWNTPQSSTLFAIAAFLSIKNFIQIITLSLVFKCKHLGRFVTQFQRGNQKSRNDYHSFRKLNRQKWRNDSCDQYFYIVNYMDQIINENPDDSQIWALNKCDFIEIYLQEKRKYQIEQLKLQKQQKQKNDPLKKK